MASNVSNVKIGVCNMYFDGVDLGYTKGGVSVKVETTTYEKKVDQFGETLIGNTITGRKVTVSAPLAETTIYNLARIMPGATLTATGGARATGTVTFVTTAPVNNDKVTIGGVDYTFKTAPTAGNVREMAIPANITAAATALAAAVNADVTAQVSATSSLGVVTLTAKDYGTAGNAITLVKTGTNITVSGATMSGGTTPTQLKVTVGSSTSLDMIDFAKMLVLRPQGKTDATEDFTVFKAATAGGLDFAYSTDNERVFTTEFHGYPDNSRGDALFCFGDLTAT